MAHDFRHLALFVNDLRAAEDFYREALGLEVLFREVVSDDGDWLTLRPGKDWDDAEAAGVDISMVALQRDDLTLAIFPGEPQAGTVVEIGVTVPVDEIEVMDRRLPEEAVRIRHEYGDLYFADPFGFNWHITPTGTAFVSNGEIAGHWLDI